MSAKTDLRRFLDWCASQVGAAETGENNIIYNTRYYGGEVRGAAYPWCCTFIWDAFRETGLSALFCDGGKTAYCPYVMGWAKSHGQWVTGGYRAGDLLLYDWDGDGTPEHIGVCVEVYGDRLATVEGNVDNAVKRLARSAASVMGAYRPAWADEAAPTAAQASEPAAAENASQSATDAQSGVRAYIVQPYDSLWKIARDELGDENRWPEIFELNNLTSTVIRPGDLLRLPEVAGEDPGELPELCRGDVGQAVQALQLLLQRAGYPLPDYGADGDFGHETETALIDFQTVTGLPATATTTYATWVKLVGG